MASFHKPTIVHVSNHISGLIEIGVGYGKTVYFLITNKEKASEDDEISVDELNELIIIQGDRKFSRIHCACCEKQEVVIDRGVPLCDDHDREQEKEIRKRPMYFADFEYNKKDPLAIIF